MPKLYEISLQGELYVIADSIENAEEIARSGVEEILASGSHEARFHTRVVSSLYKNVHERILNNIPYNTGSLTGTFDYWFDENKRQEEYEEFLRLQIKYAGGGQ
jgi:hypothetical protein